MLEAESLGLQRGGRTLLQGLDLRLMPGEVLGVLGPNGVGKSSLLGALSGELRPSAGRVRLDGTPLADWPGPARARRLAVLPQGSALGFAFSVEQVVALGRLPHATGAEADAGIVRQALAAVDMLGLATRSYLRLSGGERQRVHLARVLAQLWPGEVGGVLLLDEPTAALDPLHQRSVLEAVRACAGRGVAVLAVLHDLNLAARYCDRLLLLDPSGPPVTGAPADVLEAATLRRVFGIDVLIERHPERGHPLVVMR